jgi:hypothetical protein
MRRSMKAAGDIAMCRFVKQDTTQTFRVLVAGAGEKVFGISHQSSRRMPYLSLDDGFAAKDGEDLSVYCSHETCLLELGGTVAVGDRIKSGALGVGVVTTTNLDEWGAIALEAGVSGDLVKVEVYPNQQISAA